MRAMILTMAMAVAGALASSSFAAPNGRVANARITGDVLVCNIPGHCITRVFRVSATDSAGGVAAQTLTTGEHNHYLLSVPAGRYSLLANSDGLRCTGSVVAVAHKTVTADITCLVP